MKPFTKTRRIVYFLIAFSLLPLFRSLSVASPCDEDVQKFCGDIQPGQGALGNCLQSQGENLSFQCREWMKKVDGALRRIGNACTMSAREFCRDVRPGYGRIINCLRSNWDKLPTECQDAITNAGK